MKGHAMKFATVTFITLELFAPFLLLICVPRIAIFHLIEWVNVHNYVFFNYIFKIYFIYSLGCLELMILARKDIQISTTIYQKCRWRYMLTLLEFNTLGKLAGFYHFD
jgi:hypothetical protein